MRLSSNRAAVQLLTTVGLKQTMKQAKKFGFDDLPAVPSVALGSGEVTLSAITAAYGAFANNGALFITSVASVWSIATDRCSTRIMRRSRRSARLRRT